MAGDLKKLLAEADARNGFPAGTMASVMKQESGGNSKFITNPEAYHYEAGPDGRRIAGHTGKVSSAFGPFGILESTAKDPGYGVKPLQSKDLDEQVRFAADYLAARSKASGGLASGLAGYGEGEKYAQQVVSRLPGQVKSNAPVQVAKTAPVVTPIPDRASPVVEEVAPAAPVLMAQAEQPAPVAPSAPAPTDPWQEFLATIAPQAKPVQAQDLAWDQPRQVAAVPSFMSLPVQSRPVDFRAFGQWGARV